MNFPMIFRPPATNPPQTTSGYCCSKVFVGLPERFKKRGNVTGKRVFRVRATVERDGLDAGERKTAGAGAGGGYTGSSAMEVTTFNQGFTSETEFPVWDKIGAVVRLSYGIGIYGAMVFAGNFICSTTGIDSTGGYSPSLDAIVQGLGYAAPPIMALLFILDDEVVKLSPHARAIRDVEDEELRSFFYGMSPWQFIMIVAASSVGEELFYRAAVQGALADVFLRGNDLVANANGMAALTGVLPPFVPFAQAFAAVITAALTGSLYYVAASPKENTVFILSLFISFQDFPMASVEVESAANTMPEKVEPTPEAPKEVEPVVAAPPAPEPVVEELKEETTADTPPPVEEPAATPQVVVEADADVVEEPNIEVEETKAETTQEEVKTAEEALVKEDTPVTKEEVPEETLVTKEAVPEDTPVTEEAKEAVEEGEMPTEVVATTEVATEE